MLLSPKIDKTVQGYTFFNLIIVNLFHIYDTKESLPELLLHKEQISSVKSKPRSLKSSILLNRFPMSIKIVNALLNSLSVTVSSGLFSMCSCHSFHILITSSVTLSFSVETSSSSSSGACQPIAGGPKKTTADTRFKNITEDFKM